MKAKKEYYKVVSSSLESYIKYREGWNNPNLNGIAIQYKENEWVYGDNLFVFDDKDTALRWANCAWDDGDLIVYKCEVKSPRKIRRIVLWSRFDDIKLILKLKKQKKKYTHLLNYTAPAGSVVCSGVKLLRKVR